MLIGWILDINIGNWNKDADGKGSVRKSTYIKHLGMAIGNYYRIEYLPQVQYKLSSNCTMNF
jgi:hypothetical protein